MMQPEYHDKDKQEEQTAAVNHPNHKAKTMSPYLYSETSVGQTQSHTHRA